MQIPFAIGLLGPNGAELPMRLDGEAARPRPAPACCSLTEPRQMFRFVDVPAPPVPSLLRGFSAPVKLHGRAARPAEIPRGPRHRAGRPLGSRPAGRDQHAARPDRRATAAAAPMPPLDPDLVAAMRQTLADADARPGFCGRGVDACRARRISPTRCRGRRRRDPRRARGRPRRRSAQRLAAEFAAAYRRYEDPGPYRIDGASIGRRALRNVCLAYLAAGDPRGGRARSRWRSSTPGAT